MPGLPADPRRRRAGGEDFIKEPSILGIRDQRGQRRLRPDYQLRFYLRRGDAVEAIHRGAWVCVDTTGAVVAGVSDPLQPVFPRSASKSFQALPLVTTGAADAFGFDAGDLALAMASHSGEAIHVERVLASLERLGLTEDDLQCGPQQPIAAWSNQTKRRASNNCSTPHSPLE